ncbi:hypothetical protein TNCV_1706491 [Trichonephila clavipes]|uniref:Uncharacterized protein n=1 Tax=Trichonephila clavipes TaxID=2585209 RepID=A0A8X6V2N0_TRICX|nr:hypothetical protein TNCV_1706491 [Trichonephila clavipes]
MYKNALKEDLKRVVEKLDGIVESTDTIVKLKTKIENSSTFESDPDFVKTLIQNCIDERVSRNEREILLWSPWKYRCGQRTVRMAVVACSQSQAVFARRRSKPKLKLLDIRAERAERERRTREVREQALPSEYHRQTYL